MYLIRNNMLGKIQCVFILATAPVIIGLKLQVDGKMDFGPKWNYEYRIKPLEGDSEKRNLKAFTSMDRPKSYARENTKPPRFVDIIIKNKNANPRLIQVAEAHIFDRNKGNKAEQTIVNIYPEASKSKEINKNKRNEDSVIKFSDEHTDATDNLSDDKTKTGKNVHHIIRIADDDNLKPVVLEEFENTLEISTKRHSKTAKRQKRKRKNQTKNHTLSREGNDATDKGESTEKDYITTSDKVNIASFKEPEIDSSYMPEEIYIKSRLVKDDPKIKEFTRHLYEQSIKTFETIKDKLDNYDMKKESDRLMRSYEDKFGEFVRETQNQRIKTRMGSKKVILNTLDTSNRILDRLFNYMIGKIDKKGILRNSGAENVIKNELNKNKVLENKHICAKMNICPVDESYTKFVIDVFGIFLKTNDSKLVQIRDASTEILKNADFVKLLEKATQKRVLKGIGHFERYKVTLLRPIFSILMNVLSSKNSPIKVVGREDGRVNKTLAYLELMNFWEKNIPPNEQNILEWNDMRNSFSEWSVDKRKDTVDLIQHFINHGTKIITPDNVQFFEKNFNTILGY